MPDGGDVKDYAPVEVNFDPPSDAMLLFDGMHAEQELGRPFMIHLDMSSGEPKAGVQSLVGRSCSVWLYDADNQVEKNHYFHGIVTRLISPGLQGGAYRYKLELRPWIWLLSQIEDCRIFQKMSAFKIITTIFRDAGFSDFEDKRQSGAGDVELEYCVQYRESSLDFVTRLMEQFGFYYFFEHSKTAHKLILVDDTNAHEKVAADIPFTFDQTEFRTVEDHIYEWANDFNLNSSRWTFNDYNFETPSADLTAKTVGEEDFRYADKLEIYEYPGPYDTTDHGQRLSDVRMQALIRDRQIFAGQSNSRLLHCGWRFKLTQHLDSAVNREYLITHSVTIVMGAEGTPNPEADSVDTYRVQLKGIPSDKSFRLRRRTRRPMIRGPQTAKVVGASGDEVMTDEYGRIKVKFHWDRATVSDEDRTCWIRVAQSWAGGSWGAMTIPRVGQEVVVEFLEGNPDRPLITGVVYNATNKVPYPLPDNKTRTVLKSNSSTGGSGFNEFRFEDKAGEEEIYIHAQKDYKREVLHDETLDVTNDRTHTIKSGNDKLTVSTGNHTIDISAGASEISAAKSITLKVAGNSIVIDTKGITINGTMLDFSGSSTVSMKASASMTLDGGGAMTVKAGMVSIN